MIGGVHVGVERESTLSFAVIRCIALRSYDPVLQEGGGEGGEGGEQERRRIGSLKHCLKSTSNGNECHQVTNMKYGFGFSLWMNLPAIPNL